VDKAGRPRGPEELCSRRSLRTLRHQVCNYSKSQVQRLHTQL